MAIVSEPARNVEARKKPEYRREFLISKIKKHRPYTFDEARYELLGRTLVGTDGGVYIVTAVKEKMAAIGCVWVPFDYVLKNFSFRNGDTCGVMVESSNVVEVGK